MRFQNSLSYVLLLLAFGVVVPYLKGLEFFNPQLMSAYACMGTIFSGPMVAQSFRNKPSGFGQAAQWIVQAVLWGELIILVMLGCGILTVYLTHLNRVFFPPDVPSLAVSCGLGVAISLAIAASAGWLTVQFSPAVARTGLRVIFLGLVALFFFRGQWLPFTAGPGTLIALALAAIFLTLVYLRLRPHAAA